jgi:hypothetical protein
VAYWHICLPTTPKSHLVKIFLCNYYVFLSHDYICFPHSRFSHIIPLNKLKFKNFHKVLVFQKNKMGKMMSSSKLQI